MENKKKIKVNIIQYEKNLMIELTVEERKKLALEITSIVENFEKYHSLDLTNTKPTHYPIVVKQQLRKDIVISPINESKIIESSCNYKNGFIGIKNDK